MARKKTKAEEERNLIEYDVDLGGEMVAARFNVSDLHKILTDLSVFIHYYTKAKNKVKSTIDNIISPSCEDSRNRNEQYKYNEGRWTVFTMPSLRRNGKTTNYIIICVVNLTKEKMRKIINLKAFL